jgi:hypothetical protein
MAQLPDGKILRKRSQIAGFTGQTSNRPSQSRTSWGHAALVRLGHVLPLTHRTPTATATPRGRRHVADTWRSIPAETLKRPTSRTHPGVWLSAEQNRHHGVMFTRPLPTPAPRGLAEQVWTRTPSVRHHPLSWRQVPAVGRLSPYSTAWASTMKSRARTTLIDVPTTSREARLTNVANPRTASTFAALMSPFW